MREDIRGGSALGILDLLVVTEDYVRLDQQINNNYNKSMMNIVRMIRDIVTP